MADEFSEVSAEVLNLKINLYKETKEVYAQKEKKMQKAKIWTQFLQLKENRRKYLLKTLGEFLQIKYSQKTHKTIYRIFTTRKPDLIKDISIIPTIKERSQQTQQEH